MIAQKQSKTPDHVIRGFIIEYIIWQHAIYKKHVELFM